MKPPKPNFPHFVLPFALAACLSLAPSAHADTYTWNSAGTAFPTVAASWLVSGGTVPANPPGPGDTITGYAQFGTLRISSGGTVTVDWGAVNIGSDSAAHSWNWDANGASGVGNIIIENDLSFSNAQTLNVRPNTAGAKVSITVKGNMTVSGGGTVFLGVGGLRDESAIVNGLTTIDNGTISVVSPDAEFKGGVTLKNAGVFAVSNTASGTGGVTAAFLSGTDSTANIVEASTTSNASATGTLTLNGSSGTAQYNGAIRNGGTGGSPSTFALNKTGANVQILSGTNNSYGGGTTISAGTLLITNTAGSATGSSSVVVTGSNTMFGGAGSAAATAAGSSISIGARSILVAGDGDSTVSAGEKLSLTGTVSLADNSKIEFTLGTSGTHTTLALAGATATFDSDQSVQFLLASGVTSGTFNGLITGLGADPGVTNWLSNLGGHFTFSGNSVNFIMDAVPEPQTWVLLGAAGTIALLRRRRCHV